MAEASKDIKTLIYLHKASQEWVKALTKVDLSELEDDTLAIPAEYDSSIAFAVSNKDTFETQLCAFNGCRMCVLPVDQDTWNSNETIQWVAMCRAYGVKVLLHTDSKNENAIAELIRDHANAENTFEISSESKPKQFTEFLREKVSELSPLRGNNHLFTLVADHVFETDDHNSVVTGTVFGGSVKTKDSLYPSDSDIAFKVTGIESFLSKQKSAYQGMRAALSLSHEGADNPEKGCLLCEQPHQSAPEVLASVSVNNRREVKLGEHVNVTVAIPFLNVAGKMTWLHSDEESEDGIVFARIKFEQSIPTYYTHHLVLSKKSPKGFLGVAKVLCAAGNGLKLDPIESALGLLTSLKNLSDSREDQALVRRAVLELLATQKVEGLSVAELSLALNMKPKALLANIEPELRGQDIIATNTDPDNFSATTLLLPASLERFEKALLRELGRVADSSSGPWIEVEKLQKTAGKRIPAELFERTLQSLVAGTMAEVKDAKIKLKGATKKKATKPGQPVETPKQEKTVPKSAITERMLKLIQQAGYTAPSLGELSVLLNVPAVVAKGFAQVLMEREQVVQLGEDLFIDRQALERLKGMLSDYFESEESLSASDFKTMLKIPRKFVVPLLEQLDKMRWLERGADDRRTPGQGLQ